MTTATEPRAKRFDGELIGRLRGSAEAAITPEMVRAHGLSDEEFEQIRGILGRPPTLVEFSIFAVMWSEHCCYKSSRKLLSTLPTEGPRILQGPGENAGAVDLGGGLAVAFKVESHNHPSFVMPYHGAATGVGGILRDIFTLGARPIALLDALRFGPSSDRISRAVFRGVVDGIAGYGNCIGVPTVGGEVFFDESFRRNPLVNVMAVGTVAADGLVLGRADGPGNPVYLLGASTGRDGIHGATFASDVMAGDGADRPQVQIGDPFVGKELMEAVLELAVADYLVGIQDMGAAGLTCSSIEMSARSGTGMVLDLEQVPVREPGMAPHEIMLSESQERMLAVVEAGSEARLEDLFAGRDLVCRRVGEVAAGGRLVIRWHGETVADMPVGPLADGAPVVECASAPPAGWRPDAAPAPLPTPMPGLEASLLQLLASENLRSRQHVFSQYDHTVRGDTVLRPGDGDAAVLRLEDRDDAIAVTLDGNSRYVALHPREGAALTVAEAARNLACAGARPLAVTNCLNFADPGQPQVFWTFSESVAGLGEACRVLETPVTGGNVSFYNETGDQRVLPSPTIGMVGQLGRVEQARGMGWRAAGDAIALLGTNRGRLSGSEYQMMSDGRPSGSGPGVDLEAERALIGLLVETSEPGLLRSAHDVSQGGLLVTLAECCLAAGDLGAEIDAVPGVAAEEPAQRADALFFGEEGGRAVVSYAAQDEARLRELAEAAGVDFQRIGQVGQDRLWVTGMVDLGVAEMRAAWCPRDGISEFRWPVERSSEGKGRDRDL